MRRRGGGVDALRMRLMLLLLLLLLLLLHLHLLCSFECHIRVVCFFVLVDA